MAGYSGKSLKDKLGIKSGADLLVVNPPRPYNQIVSDLDNKIHVAHLNTSSVEIHSTSESDQSFIHAFFVSNATLVTVLPILKKMMAKDGTLWISWPKRSSNIESDLDENIIRELGLDIGLVDVKVCAVDNDWSALKFVYRLKDR